MDETDGADQGRHLEPQRVAQPPVESPPLTKAADAGIHPSTPARELSTATPIVGIQTPHATSTPAQGKRTVTMKVRMTKATRRSLKAQARQRGISTKEHLARILTQAADQGTGSAES